MPARGGGPHRRGLAAIRAAVEAMEPPPAAVDDMLAIDLDFHVAVSRAAHNAVLELAMKGGAPRPAAHEHGAHGAHGLRPRSRRSTGRSSRASRRATRSGGRAALRAHLAYLQEARDRALAERAGRRRCRSPRLGTEAHPAIERAGRGSCAARLAGTRTGDAVRRHPYGARSSFSLERQEEPLDGPLLHRTQRRDPRRSPSRSAARPGGSFWARSSARGSTRSPSEELASHYAKAVADLDEHDLSMLAAWHASLEVGHPIANREFLVSVFPSLGENRREALKIAAGFRGEEAFEAGVAEEQAMETVLPHLSRERADRARQRVPRALPLGPPGLRQLTLRSRVRLRRGSPCRTRDYGVSAYE